MSDILDGFKNIYMSPIKTKEDVLAHLRKGLFYKQNRIEEVFYNKFVKLRTKIQKVLANEFDNSFDYDIYVDSILVDCRAIFLENKKYKFNSTLQASYRARHLDDFANGIDELFEKKVVGDKTLRQIIKDWVDKRVVHYEYLDPDEEKVMYEDVSKVLDRDTLDNLLHDVLRVAQQYEQVRTAYGTNAGEQFEKTLKAMTE